MTIAVLAFCAGMLALALGERARWHFWPWAGHPFARDVLADLPAAEVSPDARTWVPPEGVTFKPDAFTCERCGKHEREHEWRCAECDVPCSVAELPPCNCGRVHPAFPDPCPMGHSAPSWLYCPTLAPRPPLEVTDDG